MAHKHDHEDHHDHHHRHQGHGHDHDHDKASEMTFDQKMEKLLTHWIKHNRDHVQTYRSWAERAASENMAEISGLIEDAAAVSEKVDGMLEKALERLRSLNKS